MSLVSRTIVGAGIALAVTAILMPQSDPPPGTMSVPNAVDPGARIETQSESHGAAASARGRLERPDAGGRDRPNRPTRSEVLRGLVSLQLLQSR